MKRVFLAVLCCVALFSTKHLFAATFDGTFDPNQLYDWEMKAIATLTFTNIIRAEAKNPKNEAPKIVTVFVEMNIDSKLNVAKRIIAYVINPKSRVYYKLNKKTDHFELTIVEEPFLKKVTPEKNFPDYIKEMI
jgi:hypothetical protein